MEDYREAAGKYRIGLVWWDEGGRSGETYGRFRLFDRERLEWLFPEIRDALVR